jgi:HK97 family phage prohead protease
MEQKVFRAPIELKADGQDGEFTAVFATFNVIDHHGDVTVPGAFKNGAETVIEPWNHGWDLPAGKGVIESDGEKVWVNGRFFLSTQAGRETYQTVKELGSLAEWSYSFNIEESGQGQQDGQQVRILRQLDVAGVGPVTRGAGIGTQTVAIKQKEQPQQRRG